MVWGQGPPRGSNCTGDGETDFLCIRQGRLTISGKDARIGEQQVYFKVQAFLTDTQCEIKFTLRIHRGENRGDTAKAG